MGDNKSKLWDDIINIIMDYDEQVPGCCDIEDAADKLEELFNKYKMQ